MLDLISDPKFAKVWSPKAHRYSYSGTAESQTKMVLNEDCFLLRVCSHRFMKRRFQGSLSGFKGGVVFGQEFIYIELYHTWIKVSFQP